MRIILFCVLCLGICSSHASTHSASALSALVLHGQTTSADTPTQTAPEQTADPASSESEPAPASGEPETPPPTPEAPPADDGVNATNVIKDTQLALVRKVEDEFATDILSLFGLEKQFRSFMGYKVMGFSASEIIWSFIILMITLVFRGIICYVLFKRLRKVVEKTELPYDDALLNALEKPVSLLLLLIGFFLAIIILPLSDSLEGFIDDLFKGTTMVVLIWAGIRVIDVMASALDKVSEKKDSALHGFVPIMRKSCKAMLLVVGTLMVIDNLGYNVSGILATIGLGGAALAFASKDTIANLFGTLMIMLDRPFKVGDWIIVGNKVDGDVEAIGLRSTKVRTWPKTVISIPNGVLANEYVNNWSRMPKRRVKQYVGISYEATAEDMEGIVADIKQLLKEDEGVQQEFMLVTFTDFGESSLDILVYYFTKSTAWVPHMEVRERMNCKIMRAIQKRGLSIAFPARTLYMDGPVASKLADVEYNSRWDMQGNRPTGDGSSHPAGDGLPGDFGPSSPP